MKKAATAGLMVATFALGMMLAVFVVGSASAAGSKTTPKKQSAPKVKASSSLPADTTTTTAPGADTFFVINGTVNAASDHEILGSSAFPNFTTGAVDNYYSMAHVHLDNSPFAEGTGSPFDTGPIGQTAAAGNTQQPQYADARWPGDKDSGKATYGTEGQPYATAEAGPYRAKADASEAKNGLNGPGVDGAKTLPLPKGFDLKLREALAGWRSKWQGPLDLPRPAVTPPAGTPTLPKVPKLPVPKPSVTSPSVTTPVATVKTPTPLTPPPPTVTVPTTTLSSSGSTDGSRSLAALRTAKSPAASSESPPADGESLLSSSTSASLLPVAARAKAKTATTTTPSTTTSKASKSKKAKGKTFKAYASAPDKKTSKKKKNYALVLSGESSLGRVSLAGGQIVIEGIHVSASITNDGTPSYKAAVSVASATVGGVPVTIDQDGVHVAGQGQGLPYQQASDALNNALKQAGIQLFLVGPEVKTCGASGSGSGDSGGGGSTTTSTTTTSSSSDQSGSGSSSSCGGSGLGGGSGVCDQSSTGGGDGSGNSGPALPGAPGSTDQSSSTPPPSCDQTQMCDQAGTGTGTGTTTTTAAPAGLGGSGQKSGTTTTSTTSSRQSGTTTSTTNTTSTTSSSTTSCGGGTGLPSTLGSCAKSGSGGSTTTSDQSGMTTTTPGFGLGGGMSNDGEMTVIATGVHVVFTQPVSPPGVPAQYAEHILGDVYVDSLATPASDVPAPGLSSSSFSSSSSSCGGKLGGSTSGASASGGASSASGSGLSGASAGAGSAYGSGSQAGSTGNSLPVAFAQALHKPLWLLLSYLIWQALVIGTGWSLWNWRRDGGP